MTIRYVGPAGNDGNSGLTWALRKLTLNGVEDTPVVVGDVIYVGPGVYRETLTVDVSGGNTYVVGTVTVTNGSTTVTGAGTAFLANVAAAYEFHVRLFAANNDGVANGTATFTSAGGTFHANMIGKVIQIMARGAYKIGAVAAANSITLTDPNGLGWPGAGGGLTYSVMSGEGPYEIASVTDNNNFELVGPWNGPTLAGLAYITYEPITYIGDVTGENTDGVGGVVRITGSDNDTTITRAYGISITAKDYRIFRGFRVDMCSSYGVWLNVPEHITIEDFVISDNAAGLQVIADGQLAITIRRCVFLSHDNQAINFWAVATIDDLGHLVENCLLVGTMVWSSIVFIYKVGGITIRNIAVIGAYTGVQVVSALAVGQTVTVENSYITTCNTALQGTVVGEVTEDYNSLWLNNVDRTNVATGGNSVAYPALFSLPILHSGAKQVSGFKFPWWFGELSEWSQIQAITGFYAPMEDLRGIARPITAAKKSWGPTQFMDMERETGTVRTGSVSMAIRDAGRHQIWVPVTATSTTIKVYVYREANYAGLLPQMIIKQPGVADRVTTDVGAAGGWNLLTDTFVPAALPPYVVVELVSRNTNGAADEVFFDDLDVS